MKLITLLAASLFLASLSGCDSASSKSEDEELYYYKDEREANKPPEKKKRKLDSKEKGRTKAESR